MRAAVILVGDELLAGHTRDANAHYIAQRLSALGHKLRRVSMVPDENHAIAGALDVTAQLAEIVFVSGGLGPTHDDRTTEAIAERFHRKLVVDEPSWQKLLARYAGRPWVTEATREAASAAREDKAVATGVDAALRKMVTVPEGVEVLDNPAGAACGYVLREGGVAYVVMPGVPSELQAIFETHVVGPILPTGDAISLVEVDVEMAEAAFATALGNVAQAFADVEIGSYPHYGERRVTLRFKGEAKRANEALEAFFAASPEAKARVLRS